MTITTARSRLLDASRDSCLARRRDDRTPWSGAVHGRRPPTNWATPPAAATALDTNDLGDPERNQP
jgi:hypothetical protein